MEQKENGGVQTFGWDAITKECERVYPDQKNPKHYGTLIKWCLGEKTRLTVSASMMAGNTGISSRLD